MTARIEFTSEEEAGIYQRATDGHSSRDIACWMRQQFSKTASHSAILSVVRRMRAEQEETDAVFDPPDGPPLSDGEQLTDAIRRLRRLEARSQAQRPERLASTRVALRAVELQVRALQFKMTFEAKHGRPATLPTTLPTTLPAPFQHPSNTLQVGEITDNSSLPENILPTTLPDRPLILSEPKGESKDQHPSNEVSTGDSTTNAIPIEPRRLKLLDGPSEIHEPAHGRPSLRRKTVESDADPVYCPRPSPAATNGPAAQAVS